MSKKSANRKQHSYTIDDLFPLIRQASPDEHEELSPELNYLGLSGPTVDYCELIKEIIGSAPQKKIDEFEDWLVDSAIFKAGYMDSLLDHIDESQEEEHKSDARKRALD